MAKIRRPKVSAPLSLSFSLSPPTTHPSRKALVSKIWDFLKSACFSWIFLRFYIYIYTQRETETDRETKRQRQTDRDRDDQRERLRQTDRETGTGTETENAFFSPL